MADLPDAERKQLEQQLKGLLASTSSEKFPYDEVIDVCQKLNLQMTGTAQWTLFSSSSETREIKNMLMVCNSCGAWISTVDEADDKVVVTTTDHYLYTFPWAWKDVVETLIKRPKNP